MASVRDRIVGHQETLERLSENITRGTFSHAWMFAGPTGIGKRQVALSLAQVLICESREALSPKACGICGPCRRVYQGASESLLTLAPTNNQIRLDEARHVFEFLSLKSLGPARVVVIDGADQLNPQAANALLKTLEEPPRNTYFFLITGSAQDVLLTIRSRTQLVRFRALTASELHQIVPAAPWIISSSQGRVELAKNLMDEEKSELRASAMKLFESLAQDSMWSFMQNAKSLASDRESTLEILLMWQQFLRDFLFSKVELPGFIHQDLMDGSVTTFWKNWSREKIQRAFELSVQAEHDVRANIDKGLALERVWIHVRQSKEGPFAL